MNVDIARRGSSFKGAVTYITHDVKRDTTERVLFMGTLNLRTDDPEKAAKVMAWTALHAAELKQAAGLPPTGKKLTDPVYHFSLSWEPSQKPTRQDMTEAVVSALKHLKLAEHEAVYAAHGDTPHPHIHVVVNRVHPQTGRAVDPFRDYEGMQRWAWEYEKRHGHIFCIDRALKYERDPAQRAELERRRAQKVERQDHQPNRPRAQWEAEREAPYPTSRAANELRGELAAKATELAAEGRAQAARQRAERTELWQAYQDQKRALWERQCADRRRESAPAVKQHLEPLQRAQQAERSALRDRQQREQRDLAKPHQVAERAAVDRLFRAQREELRDFLRTSHRQGWVGAIATAVQATRAAPAKGQQEGARGLLANLARFAAATLSADRRTRLFLDSQKAEREGLRAQIRRRQASALRRERVDLRIRHETERDALHAAQRHQRDQAIDALRRTPAAVQGAQNVRERYSAKRTDLHRLYVAARDQLQKRQAQERMALRARWAAHDADRRTAWTRYRAERGQVQASGSKRAMVSRDVKAEQAARAFSDAGRRADTRATSVVRKADAGRVSAATSTTMRGPGLRRG